ncbi:MAG: AAA family ATPase [Tepidisphaeraceae bacterium]
MADFSPGLNVIFGPNETGKSTLMDALCRGLFDKHGTGGSEMQTRQPWASELGPAVEIEFTVDGERYRLAKQFLQEQKSVLRRVLPGGDAERIAEGRTADAKVIELINGRDAGRGLTKPEHWGLGQVLWAGQGDATRLSVGDDQQARLREALKLTLDSTQGTALEAEVRRRYEAIFTPQGKYKTGQGASDAVRIADDITAAEKAVAELEFKRRDADEIEFARCAVEDDHAVAVARSGEAKRTLEAARATLVALAEQQTAYQAIEHAARDAQAAFALRQAAVEAIRQADETAAAARHAANESEARHAEISAGVAMAKARQHAAATVRDDTRRRAQHADEHCAAAERLVTFIADRDAALSLRQKIESAEAAAAAISAAEAELQKLLAPSAQQMKALRQLDRQRRAACQRRGGIASRDVHADATGQRLGRAGRRHSIAADGQHAGRTTRAAVGRD